MKPPARYTPVRQTRSWFASLATGPRMLIVFALALLPLGVIAVWGSINAAWTSRASDRIEAQAELAVAAQRLTSIYAEAAVIIRVASGSLIGADAAAAERACDRAAVQLSRDGIPVRFALYAQGNRLVCTTQGYAPPDLPLLPPANATSQVFVDPQGRFLRLTLYDPSSGAQGQVELPSALLSRVAESDSQRGPREIQLIAEGGTITLHDDYEGSPLAREVSLSTDLLMGRAELRLRREAPALSLFELFTILLPVLMWLLAAVIGWLIVHRALLRPLGAMQKAISAYRPGDTGFQAPASRSPAREISDLGDAFDQVTRTVARHEAQLEAGIERQTKLVREVHHRVKNNLQVVASLLNIHSRGSQSDEAAAAYASIQRRVDALAVVHRNHYAEAEQTPGVPLRALISELGASLRASAPAGASKLQIRMALEPLYSNQDVAVAVAFLITEAVEFAMLCGGAQVSVTLEQEAPDRARLSIDTGALAADAPCSDKVRERFERIMTGLARQLRSTPERDPDAGRFTVSVAIVGKQSFGDD